MGSMNFKIEIREVDFKESSVSVIFDLIKANKLLGKLVYDGMKKEMAGDQPYDQVSMIRPWTGETKYYLEKRDIEAYNNSEEFEAFLSEEMKDLIHQELHQWQISTHWVIPVNGEVSTFPPSQQNADLLNGKPTTLN